MSMYEYNFVDIPTIIYLELAKYVNQVDEEDYGKYLEWAYTLYIDFNGPMVRYRVNNQLLPDIYGYLYNYYLIKQDMYRAFQTIH